MKGDDAVDQLGVYGVKGISAASNKPGARNYSATWRDVSGNLWLFGGSGYESSGFGFLNDLWKYDPVQNAWTWLSGDSVMGQVSIYGTQGTSHIDNKPGATYAGVSWTDASGNLWLFGGLGYTHNDVGLLNSLWKYNPSTNQWNWIKGDSAINRKASYGSKGVSHTTNQPGSRYGSLTWTDANGKLWLFGGYGYDSTAMGVLNDLWKYDPAINQWTWVQGESSINMPGVYGTKGISNAANCPGARYVSTSWTDEWDNLWLFGGYGYDESSTGNLNDLWRYKPSTNEWTWISGDKIKEQPGIYGVRGVANLANKPGARYMSNCWTNENGELWLFGGYGNDTSNVGYLNDLWKFNLQTSEWTWVKGDNTIDQLAIYGVQGIAADSNKSGARTGGVSWSDGEGTLWMFGGYGFDGSSSGVLNDLWKITSLNSILPLKLLGFSGTFNNNLVTLNWQAENETAFTQYIIERSFDGAHFTQLNIISCAGTAGRNSYQYIDTGIANYNQQKTFYRLKLLLPDGSYTYSKTLLFSLDNHAMSISLFPNPATHTLNLSFEQEKSGVGTIGIFDMGGNIIRSLPVTINSGRTFTSVDVYSLPAATYIISLLVNDQSSSLKFIKK